MKDLIKLAQTLGFAHGAMVDARKLEFREEVREMCAEGKCGGYGKNWCCPPACGSLEEMAQRVREFSQCLLVSSVGKMEDDFDYEGMMRLEQEHKERFEMLVEQLRKEYDRVLPMGAGTCRRCKTCTYPDAPCRFPELQIYSMEACGLLVSQVCQMCGMPYYNGPGTMAYFSCVFLP